MADNIVSLQLSGAVEVLNPTPSDPRKRVSALSSISNSPLYFVGFDNIYVEDENKHYNVVGGNDVDGWNFEEVGAGGGFDSYANVSTQSEFLTALADDSVEVINIAKTFTLSGLNYGNTVIDLNDSDKVIQGLPLVFKNSSSIWFETDNSANIKVYSDLIVLNTSTDAALCEKPYTLRGDVNLFFRNIFNDNFFLAGQNSIYEFAKDQNGVEDEPAGSPSPQGFWDNTFRKYLNLSDATGDTGLLLYDVTSNTFKDVEFGSDNSAGSGYKVLRVVN